MTNSLCVENFKRLRNLLGDLCGSCNSLFAILDVFAQVSVAEILHREKVVGLILIPAIELDKEMLMLDRSSPLARYHQLHALDNIDTRCG